MTTMQQHTKTISLSFLICGALIALLGRQVAETIWVMARLPIPAGWVLAPADLIACVLGVLVFVILIRHQRASVFVGEVISELGKVVWPNRRETVLSTGVVAVLVGICSVILFGFDMLWGTIVGIFYR